MTTQHIVSMGAAILAAGLVGAGLGAASARAAVYHWTVSLPTDSAPIDGSGQITTANTLTNGGYLVTAISGTYGAATITGLAPVDSIGNNDNLIFYPTGPFLDLYGIGFYTDQDPGAGEGTYVNLFYVPSSGYTDGYTYFGSFSVPESSTWAMLIVGTVALGCCARRRRASLNAA